jgi:hypothetical protein
LAGKLSADYTDFADEAVAQIFGIATWFFICVIGVICGQRFQSATVFHLCNASGKLIFND